MHRMLVLNMLLSILAPILSLHAPTAVASEWPSPSPSSISAFASSIRPTVHSSSWRPHAAIILEAQPSKNSYDDGGGMVVGDKQIVIQQIGLDEEEELERMSKFCINAFYTHDEVGEGSLSLLSRKWKDIKLGAMQKAQLLDISLSTKNDRCIFVAKAILEGNSEELIGCCEVIEERLDITPSQQQSSNSKNIITTSERERRKTARPRPVIENLCVKQDYRRYGVGAALVHACERAVQQQWLGHYEVFAQVEDDNVRAYQLFQKCGYQSLFADPTCAKMVLDDALFAKEITVTKRTMRKILEDENGYV